MLCVKEINPSFPRGYQPCSIPSLPGVEFLVGNFQRTVNNWVQVSTAIANYVAILSLLCSESTRTVMRATLLRRAFDPQRRPCVLDSAPQQSSLVLVSFTNRLLHDTPIFSDAESPAMPLGRTHARHSVPSLLLLLLPALALAFRLRPSHPKARGLSLCLKAAHPAPLHTRHAFLSTTSSALVPVLLLPSFPSPSLALVKGNAPPKDMRKKTGGKSTAANMDEAIEAGRKRVRGRERGREG
ncbi:hypothetical protein Naga_100967g2 [Nannochloropsis gaditana]|uniref:Uncharacterized protein n=1 Tax=Nannochloropsis gaditana TaxID=72520 RepID=W7T875_9STRA|nr:hypothetical protein Naga_100967g2 [Nannochloropsis gaditana]